ncbi:assimilatory nitrate reductase [Oryzomicrobium terrae]|uniref:Assimilatory nitrate reductase n=1 Tax=Oryzomicrobium terrae TaxID=1735038 RepID=A0A5C1E6X7_9RHOO|nr:nitrate reductase [Oryzomicrobium terrae]QEL64435.1 assimilatory nitrate reductase [Oryzomicrobium terrae]
MTHETRSTCCYCGVGCGVLIAHDQERITGVRGDPDHPANFGRLCTKGASLHLSARPESRLLHPQLRSRAQDGRRGAPRRVLWDEALDHTAQRFAEIVRAHGPDSVAFYLSGQLLTEDYYVFNKLAKALITTNNVDTNSRLCMSSAAAGYKLTLGVDAPPCSYEDMALADCLFIAGANPAVAHPILYRRIEDARAANPKLKVIVADPRRSETAAQADLHLALKPGTDIALYHGMLHVMIAEGLLDEAYIESHTEGFDALRKIVREYAPDTAAVLTGVPTADIVTAARWFAQAGAALSLYCQGLNQSTHGSHNNVALIHLHLATGQIGRAGAGPFSLTGQPNAMGGREVGGMAHLLPGHREVANPDHRAEIARFWGVPWLSPRPGLKAIDLFAGLKRGHVKAVWIACTNPAQSLPHQAEVRQALAAAELVVVQEAFADAETLRYADVILPASTWGEKEGTVTNSERRISRVRAAVPPAGEARADWAIACDFARRLGRELGLLAADALFDYPDPEAIFDEHRRSTEGRDLDIGGLSYATLERQGPQQWPYRVGASGGTARLYTDGRFETPSGRARFVPCRHQGTADRTDTAFPFALLSGRMRDQWHGMTRTGTVPRLFNQEAEALLRLHPADLRQIGLDEGGLARVANGRGSIIVRVKGDAGMRPGSAWLPMHWGERFMSSAGANVLTPASVDPISGQPELKHAAVRIEAAALPWQLAVIQRVSDATAAAALAQARQWLGRFSYAAVSFHGGKRPVVILRAAAEAAASPEMLAELDQAFGLERPGGLSYADPARGVAKRAALDNGELTAIRLAGETLASAWLPETLAGAGLDAAKLRFALAPIATPPADLGPPREIVCKCADVDRQTLVAAFAAGESVAMVQERLKCGGYCGGCVPDLRRLHGAAQAPAVGQAA